MPIKYSFLFLCNFYLRQDSNWICSHQTIHLLCIFSKQEKKSSQSLGVTVVSNDRYRPARFSHKRTSILFLYRSVSNTTSRLSME